MAAATASWAVGAWAPVARVWGHGGDSRMWVTVLAAMLALWAVALRVSPSGPIVHPATWLAGPLLAVLVTESVLGRAPALVGVAGVAVMHRSVRVRPSSVDDERSPTRVSLVGVLAAIGAGATWAAFGSNRLTGGLLLAGLAVTAVRSPAWAPGPPVRAALASLGASGSEVLARMGSTCRRPLVVSGRDAARRWRYKLRPVRSWGWLRLIPWPAMLVVVLFWVSRFGIWWDLAHEADRFSDAINDWQGHIVRAELFQFWPPRSASPHFLFHALISIVGTWAEATVAAVLVVAAAYGAVGWVLYRFARRTWDGRPALSRWAAVSLPIAYLVMASPVHLVPAGSEWWMRPHFDPHGTGGQLFLLHVWGSPTSILALPLGLVLFVALLELMLDTGRRPLVSSTVALGALTVATTFAKPAITLVLLVAVPWHALRAAPATVRWRTIALGFLVPGAITSGYQAVFLAAGLSELEQTTWTVEPLWLWFMGEMYRPMVLAGGALIPLCIWIGGRRYLRNPPIRLALLACAVAIVPTFVLRETGDKADHANLAWTMIFSLTILLIFSLHFLLVDLQERWRQGRLLTRPVPSWLPVLAVVVAVQIAAGVMHQLLLRGIVSF